ncbi:MAG: HisA/HisF-related TIM barrel protein, partial [Bacteroidales bacterium]
MRIIIALDILGGKCVRLTKGDFSTIRVYKDHPLEFAKELEDHGIKFIHLVDLDGAKNKHITNYGILEKIASKTSLTVDFGGGIRSSDDLNIAFNSGATQVTGGSISVTNQNLFLEWLEKWGSDRIILGADCKDRKISTEG